MTGIPFNGWCKMLQCSHDCTKCKAQEQLLTACRMRSAMWRLGEAMMDSGIDFRKASENLARSLKKIQETWKIERARSKRLKFFK